MKKKDFLNIKKIRYPEMPNNNKTFTHSDSHKFEKLTKTRKFLRRPTKMKKKNQRRLADDLFDLHIYAVNKLSSVFSSSFNRSLSMQREWSCVLKKTWKRNDLYISEAAKKYMLIARTSARRGPITRKRKWCRMHTWLWTWETLNCIEFYM